MTIGAQMSQVINSNPALSRGFKMAGTGDDVYQADTMTLSGAVDKTIISMIVLLATAFLGWKVGLGGASGIAAIVGLVIGLIISFKPTSAPALTIPYAVLQGFFLGGISRLYNEQYDGIVLTAVGLTLSIFAVLLFIYKARLINVSRNFILAVAAGTAGVFLFYMISLVGGLFGWDAPLVNSNSGWGILFSVFVVVLASANLVVDFDFIENGAKGGAPKYMEWYGAFGLMVTVIWLYLELLRLLAKLRSR